MSKTNKLNIRKTNIEGMCSEVCQTDVNFLKKYICRISCPSILLQIYRMVSDSWIFTEISLNEKLLRMACSEI